MTVPTINADTTAKPGMKCPSCNLALIMADRQNIEIDYCPECRGIWLDRGELDKIIERSLQTQSNAPQDDNRNYREDSGHRGGKHGGGRGHGGGHGGGRRGSWLQDIFH